MTAHKICCCKIKKENGGTFNIRSVVHAIENIRRPIHGRTNGTKAIFFFLSFSVMKKKNRTMY